MDAATQRPGTDSGVSYATVFLSEYTGQKNINPLLRNIQAERILPWQLTVKRFLSNQIIGIHDNANTGNMNLATRCFLFGTERLDLRRSTIGQMDKRLWPQYKGLIDT
jgi:hypothetical protein